MRLKTLSVKRVQAGHNATQVFEADKVDAKDITAGDNSCQCFGDGALSIIDILRRPTKEKSKNGNVGEEVTANPQRRPTAG